MTGEKKPKEKPSIWNAFGKHTGLSGALKDCDKSKDAVQDAQNKGDAKKAEKELKTFASKCAAYVKAYKEYIKVLDKAITDEASKRAGPKDKTNYERALKFMKSKLEELDAKIENDIGGLTTAMDPLLANDRVPQVLANWQKMMKMSLAKAATSTKLIKSEPTPANYNDQICGNWAARNLRMQLVNAEKDCFPFKIEPRPLMDELSAFENDKLPTDATPDQVIAKLKTFAPVVRKVDWVINS